MCIDDDLELAQFTPHAGLSLLFRMELMAG